MKHFLHTWFLTLVVMASACGRQDTPPPAEEDMLYRVECFYQQNPDSALQILDTLNVSVLSEKEQAHYCLLKANLKVLARQNDTEMDSLFQVAANYFVGGKDKYYEAKTYFNLAWQYGLKGEGKQAILDYRLKALQSIEQCGHVDERLIRFSPNPTDEKSEIDRVKYAIHQRLGMSYAASGYFRESIGHLKQADSYYAEKESTRDRLITAYPLGMSYLAVNEYDSCLMYYQIGLHSAEMIGDTIEASYFHKALSTYYLYCYETQHYESEEDGVALIRQAVDECRSGLEVLRFIDEALSYTYRRELLEDLSQAYFDLQQYDSCVYYSRMTEEISAEHYNFSTHYKRLYQSYKALGDETNAAVYAEKLIENGANDGAERKVVAEVKAEYDKQQELQRVESEQQLKRYRLYLWIALLTILLMVLFGVAFRYRKNKELETLKLHEVQRQLQAELEKTTQHQKEMLQQRVLSMYQSGVGDRLRLIMDEFENAYPSSLIKLKQACPNLNDTELRIVILSFLGFRAKEMADLLGLKENTVTQYRSNLKKKADSDIVSTFVGQ